MFFIWCTFTKFCFCFVLFVFPELFPVCIYDLQLHHEYETDKQQAMDRIALEAEQSIMNMRNSIEHAYERQRDELVRRLETEQKDRLAAVKRLQWVGFVL